MMNVVNVVNFLASDVSCGEVTIPGGVHGIIHLIVLMIQVIVPILLIIWGMFDFAKSVIGGDEDKIKAGQKVFIQRLIAAVIVFLIVTVVQLIIQAVANIGGTGNDAGSAWNCADQLIKP